MRRFAFALLLLGAACEREPQAPPEAAAAVAPTERENLLSLAAGAVALERTGEMTYDTSVVHAIDGTVATYWSSPPDGPEQTLTFALPALTRLTQIGAGTAKESHNVPAAIDFSISADGRQWTPFRILRVKPGHELQKVAVNADARYIRITTTAPEKQTYTVIRSVVAEGKELEPVRPGSIDGCWSIDGMPARFEQRGAHFTGVIATPDGPRFFDGGFDGRTYLAMWLQTPMWGHAAITVTADARNLSILQWHEDVVWDHAGDGHLGQRADCTDLPFRQAAIIDGLLARAGHYSLYGPGDVDAVAQTLARHPSQPFRIVAREFHKGTARRRWEALREELRKRGADVDRIEFDSELVTGERDSAGRSVATELEKRFVGTMELDVRKGR